MPYPSDINRYPTRIDKNASGWYVSGEFFNVPLASPYEMYLDHVPADTATTKIYASGGAEWTEVTVAPASSSEFLVDYTSGKVTFAAIDADSAVEARYNNYGDDIMAEHMNNVQDEIYNTQQELGPDPAGGYPTVAIRLAAIEAGTSASGIDGDNIIDNTVRAGALKADIKGASWASYGYPTLQEIGVHKADPSAAHAASAIVTIDTWGQGVTDVQDHINLKGTASATTNNPHGLGYSDLVGGGDISFPASIYVNTNMFAQAVCAGLVVAASGNEIFINSDGPDGDSFLNFWKGDARGRHLKFNDSIDRFDLNDSLLVQGDITASGNIAAEASGTRDVGTAAEPFDQGYFDQVHASEYHTGASQGVDGFFTTVDGKTVIVKNGLIVSIV